MGYDGKSVPIGKRSMDFHCKLSNLYRKKLPAQSLSCSTSAMQQWTCGPAVLPHLTDEEIKHNLSFGHQNLGVLQVWSDPGIFGILMV